MDETEFIQLIDRHQGIIHKICRLYRDTAEDREDLFQDIVLQLWRSFAGFEGRSKISTWIYRVALSTAIAHFRIKRPDIIYRAVLPDQPQPTSQQAEQEELLLKALKRLNDADKALITLYLDGLNYEEIGDITGITANNVGVKLNRIRKKIQEYLK